MQTIHAIINEQGQVQLLAAINLPSARRAIVTILDEPVTNISETAWLSKAALAEDWNWPEEDAAWAHLQSMQAC